MNTEKIYRAWHVCPPDLLTAAHPGSPRSPIREGETISCVGVPKHGFNGMHGSKRLLDAIAHAGPGNVICLVEIWGDVDVGSSMIAGRHRRVLKIIPPAVAAIECRFFAASVYHRWLSEERQAGRETHPAGWKVVEIYRQYAVGAASHDLLKAATLTVSGKLCPMKEAGRMSWMLRGRAYGELSLELEARLLAASP